MRGQNLHGALSHLWLAIQQQQHSPHECGSPSEAAMRGLIASEITARERIGQRHPLVKAEAQPFARDGVDASGRIAD
jgi:hypothetical protein